MIRLGNRPLSLNNLKSIVFDQAEVVPSAAALKRVDRSHLFLEQFSEGKLIYGINTGFGPMAQYKIADDRLMELQYNLIRSHCSGAGDLLSQTETRSLMLVRLNSLLQGYSGVHREVILLLSDLINRGIYPCIPEHGGVGASGDLVQLAHLALGLIGEGKVWYRGKISDTATIFRKEKISPLQIHRREGIAILNGTAAMTGIGSINLIHSIQLLNWSVMLSVMINEALESFDDHFSEELNRVKPHVGQQQVAASMRALAKGSKRIRKRNEVLYRKETVEKLSVVEEKVQEYYSLRCIPQILGPVLDTIRNAAGVVTGEINSVNDNPVIDAERRNVYHGGNFHGDYVSLEMDKLKMAVTKMAMLSERQLNYLLNDKLNQKLPPFLNMGVLGLNYGLQGMQFTATSTVAECQMLSNPMYVHSIPNNNDNQDVVSMGTNSALIARRVINNAYEVMSIHAVAVVQAIDLLQCSGSLSPASQKTYKLLRKTVAAFKKDIPSSDLLFKVNGLLKFEPVSAIKI